MILRDKRLDRGEQGCAWVHENQEHAEDEVQNKANVIMVTYTVMSLSTVRKTCVFQRIQAEKEESEGGELAKDEEEKAEAI